MKKTFILLLCLIIVGCSTESVKKNINNESSNDYLLSEEELEKKSVISIKHKYYLKWFEEYIGEKEDMISYKVGDSFSIKYSNSVAKVIEKYDKNQKLTDYIISTSQRNKNVDSLFSLMITDICTMLSYDKINLFLDNEEEIATMNTCIVFKYNTNGSELTYSISVK